MDGYLKNMKNKKPRRKKIPGMSLRIRIANMYIILHT